MKRLFTRFKTKPTVFLIGGFAAILYSIPAIIYYIPKNGGESMYALLYFYLIGIAFLALIVDVGLTSAINFKSVSIIECIIIGGVYLIISNHNKTATINITNIKKPYIIIIDDQGGIGLAKFQGSGFFNKVYTVKDTDVIRINKASLRHYEVVFKGPESWEQSESDFSFYKPDYVFDCDIIAPANTAIQLSDNQMDSLLTAKSLKRRK